ncbi:MAG: hypothetical protein KIS72_02250 [Luteimonas sp.]|nr:hypothetical protein [Luteimonas sp.]
MRMEWTGGRRARRLLAVAGIAGLAACASGGGTKTPALGYDSLMSSAEAHVAASRFDDALDAFEDAARADTTRKEPWVRSAQLYFDTGNYGRAIVSAQEVLRRVTRATPWPKACSRWRASALPRNRCSACRRVAR